MRIAMSTDLLSLYESFCLPAPAAREVNPHLRALQALNQFLRKNGGTSLKPDDEAEICQAWENGEEYHLRIGSIEASFFKDTMQPGRRGVRVKEGTSLSTKLTRDLLKTMEGNLSDVSQHRSAA
jgi:hypothetical protein